jgi:transposase
MPIAIVAIDLAKDVFELAAADETGKIVERRRLTRKMLERYFADLQGIHVVMEACGTAHYRLMMSRLTGQGSVAVGMQPYVGEHPNRRVRTPKARLRADRLNLRVRDVASCTFEEPLNCLLGRGYLLQGYAD